MTDVAFYTKINRATTFLEPEHRRLLNAVFRDCELFGVPLRDALLLCHEDPWSLPEPLYWSARRADEAGVWQRIIDLCADEPELPSH